MTPELWLVGIGLAVLLPVVPFTLEMLALSRLTTAAFGTLMSLEPAFALLIGLCCSARCRPCSPCSASGSSWWRASAQNARGRAPESARRRHSPWS